MAAENRRGSRQRPLPFVSININKYRFSAAANPGTTLSNAWHRGWSLAANLKFTQTGLSYVGPPGLFRCKRTRHGDEKAQERHKKPPPIIPPPFVFNFEAARRKRLFFSLRGLSLAGSVPPFAKIQRFDLTPIFLIERYTCRRLLSLVHCVLF